MTNNHVTTMTDEEIVEEYSKKFGYFEAVPGENTSKDWLLTALRGVRRNQTKRDTEWFREGARSQTSNTFTLKQIESYLDMQ